MATGRWKAAGIPRLLSRAGRGQPDPARGPCSEPPALQRLPPRPSTLPTAAGQVRPRGSCPVPAGPRAARPSPCPPEGAAEGRGSPASAGRSAAAGREVPANPGGIVFPTRRLLLRVKFPALSAHSRCSAEIPARVRELYSPKPREFDPKGPSLRAPTNSGPLSPPRLSFHGHIWTKIGFSLSMLKNNTRPDSYRESL